jgi:hypothetical protein
MNKDFSALQNIFEQIGAPETADRPAMIPFRVLVSLAQRAADPDGEQSDYFGDIVNMTDLVNVLDELGYNQSEVYEFLLDLVVEQP